MDYENVLKKAEKRRLKIAYFFNSGMSFSEIGKEMGITKQRVHQIVKSASFLKLKNGKRK